MSMARPLSASPMATSFRGMPPVAARNSFFSALSFLRVAIWCRSVVRLLALICSEYSLLWSSAKAVVRDRRRACSWSMRDCFAWSSLRKDNSVSVIRVFRAVMWLANCFGLDILLYHLINVCYSRQHGFGCSVECLLMCFDLFLAFHSAN